MTNKVLFCATVDYHFKAFHLPVLQWFKEQGWEVHIAAKGKIDLPFTDKKFDIPIQRSPFKKENIAAYSQLKKLLEEHRYNLVHCHTPMGGVLTRLAAKNARKQGSKIIYTAHGFHFCKGSSLANWLIYYPIEKLLAEHTDCLITINKEDYELAANRRFNAGAIKHIHGVGIDTERFKPAEPIKKNELRLKYGYRKEQLLLFYAAEFNANKNQQLLIRAMANVKEAVPDAKLLLAGEGRLQDECKKLAKEFNVERNIDFLGYRKDIAELLPMCDIAVASSLREGLPVNVMEAMACGLPVIATKNRGHSELIEDKLTGFIDVHTPELMAKKIIHLHQNEIDLKKMSEASVKKISSFSINRIIMELAEVYQSYFPEVDHAKREHNRAYI
ncbi:glycosyltransferase family 4 protein [Metabacillus sp. GX 13764]|uniref:glycosyltransferase family 4 protein n=1 Tax=Metabacillus kandeliae TaxID=2900151 RepID=UPI001E49FF75|nr:glycosyltransferase family 4 protein [Metabacillus kandeliae]MCD7033137.1 glycosyltransferase family 4 protein [Metabacillus kandeliae]